MIGKARKILTYPNERLRQVSQPLNVDEIKTEETQQLIADMFTTMRIAEGLGLSAIQIGIPKQLIVLDFDWPYVVINPTITIRDQALYKFQEGCLSIPGVYERSENPRVIEVKCLDNNGEQITHTFYDLHAACMQHEYEHLHGMLFTDSKSSVKQMKYRRVITKTLRKYKKDPGKSMVY